MEVFWSSGGLQDPYSSPFSYQSLFFCRGRVLNSGQFFNAHNSVYITKSLLYINCLTFIFIYYSLMTFIWYAVVPRNRLSIYSGQEYLMLLPQASTAVSIALFYAVCWISIIWGTFKNLDSFLQSRGQQTFFCEGLESKYFMLCRP